MKKLIIVIMIFVFAKTNAQVTFQKTFKITGADSQSGWSVQQTADSGYIITGQTVDFATTGWFDMFLTYMDSDGNIIWTKTYGLPDSVERAYCVQQTADGGYIITGSIENSISGSYDIYLIKTNTAGDTLWTKAFDQSGYEQGFSVKQTADSGYIIVASRGEYTSLIKTDLQGNMVWAKVFIINAGREVQQTTDGGYIITGYTNLFGAGGEDIVLLKTDSIGNLEWVKAFGGTNNEKGFSVKQTADGGYIVTGYTTSFGVSGEDVYLIRTDANGDTLWSKTFGGTGSDYGWSVQQTADMGYIITGTRINNIFLIKTDSTGNPLWSKTFGGKDANSAYSVQQTFDGGYIISGEINYEVYIIKTDSNGNSGVSCYESSLSITTTSPATIVSSISVGLNSGAIVTNPATNVTDQATSVNDFLPVNLTTGSMPAAACFNDGQAWVTVSGGSPPFIYLWDDTASQTTDTAYNLTAGTYKVKVFYGIDCVDSATVIVESVTGLDQLHLAGFGLQIYPNPNMGKFIIKSDLSQSSNIFIKIYRFDGKYVYSKEINYSVSDHIMQIDLSIYAKGIYYVQIITDRNVLTKKVIYQ
ncbi:MAG: T9SS type A sorting domain-containing protein [Bacteroidetes bacterium]|nr:T9SS type A sorting domain-containing protein [Bacteroidota bacterium]